MIWLALLGGVILGVISTILTMFVVVFWDEMKLKERHR